MLNLSGGFQTVGLIKYRDDDALGFGVTYARTSGKARSANPDLLSHETTFELAYRIEAFRGVAIQPDFQVVMNPGAQRGVENALIAGARLEVSL